MSQEASSELLDIENKISKIQEQIERLEDNIDEKWSTVSSLKKKMLESFDDYMERENKAHADAVKFQNDKKRVIDEYKEEIQSLERRRATINEQLFGGLDESEDF